MAGVKKALVLSGGGGRGAYHIGVMEALVALGWMEDGAGPDIIAGTSIGAINAAALASGLTVAELKERWLAMNTEQVHRLSESMPAYVRPLARFFLRSILTSSDGADQEAPPEPELSAGGLLDRLSTFARSTPFRSLLDTSPWRHTLGQWMDFERINSPDSPAILLAATEVQSGALRVFANHDLRGRPRDAIGLDHLMASSSIPLVYPWTEIGAEKYWDGAVVANTPLGAVIDLAAGDELDILVVMMTPWAAEVETPLGDQPLPQDMIQAVALTLDWALLASYRQAFKSLKRANALAEAAAKLERAAALTGDDSLRLSGPVPRRIREPTVIAPQAMMPIEWIVDYEDSVHEKLFAQGYADAMAALISRAVE
ncbi:MAG TPA: patatin-like phospholipase family protein [Herpetosiphonaceae bacterium]